MRLRSWPGQGFGEYTLIGAVLVVAGVGGCMLLGSTMNDLFAGMLGGGVQRVKVADLPDMKPVVQAESEMVAPASGRINVTGDTVTLVLSNGQVLALKNYPVDIDETILTMGANGVTQQAITALETLVKESLAAGEITKPQADSLLALATQGRSIASLEKSIEDAALRAKSSQEFANTKILYEGKQYTVDGTLLDIIGWDETVSVNDEPDFMNSSAMGETGEFLKLYKQAQKSAAIQNPAIAATVEDLASRIAYLTEVMKTGICEVAQNGGSPEDIGQYMVAVTTRYDATEICSIGNGLVTGDVCQ